MNIQLLELSDQQIPSSEHFPTKNPNSVSNPLSPRLLNTVTKVIYHTSLLIDCVILLLLSRCTTPGT